jgi:hypothetical protein
MPAVVRVSSCAALQAGSVALYQRALRFGDFGTLRALARLSFCSPPPARAFVTALREQHFRRQLLAWLLHFDGCGGALLAALDAGGEEEEEDDEEEEEEEEEEQDEEAPLPSSSLRALVQATMDSRRLQVGAMLP